MHLHSANFGSAMPRVDPQSHDSQSLDRETACSAVAFAQAHEEYLTDWSLGKTEKWRHAPVDRKQARVTRNGRLGSPAHTDSESDGSEDIDDSLTASVHAHIQKSFQCDVDSYEDFAPVFTSPRTLAYELDSMGHRATRRLTAHEQALLQRLDLCVCVQRELASLRHWSGRESAADDKQLQVGAQGAQEMVQAPHGCPHGRLQLA